MTTYSQYGEDLVIAEIFAKQNRSGGRLLDLGAWDPREKSNSRLLIEQGWSAVLVEPSPGPLHNLVIEYGKRGRGYGDKVEVIAAAVGLEPGLVRMQITDDAVSSSKGDVHETWKEAGGYFGWMWVPVITLQNIFDRFAGPYDFINIDCEGLSVDIAMELLKTEAFPKVICVEEDNRMVELMTAAQKRGYVAVMANGTNVILRHG